MTEPDLDTIVLDLKVDIPLSPERAVRRSFRTFDEMKSFFEQEVRFWQEAQVNDVRGKFQSIVNLLIQATREDPNRARNNIAGAVSLASAPNDPALIYSQTSRGRFLKALAPSGQETLGGAMAYFQGTTQQFPGHGYTPDVFNGIIAAALHRHPEFVSASQAAEIQAFTEQRAAIDTFREKTNTQFRDVVDKAEQWKAGADTTIKELLNSNQDAFSQAQKNWADALQSADSTARQKAKELEELYAEKLRLEKPAEYWRGLETHYNISGRWWIGGAMLLVLGLVGFVGALVYEPPAVLTADKFTLGGLRGALLIAAAVSGFLYLISLFVKVATSCYHLARDARERCELTYTFLALIKDKAIEPKDREIILSALFSRADTGLLKHDSGPTIPTPLGTILDTLRKN